MSFLLPIWLWAAAAAAVPVLIHLLSRGRGRVVSVGTVRFLPASHSHRLRRFRPSGLLRMLLRVALLVALAVALAAPRYWSAVAPGPGERWVLVDPSLLVERQRLQAVAPEVFQRLDEVDASQRRLLTPGIPAWRTGASAGAARPDTDRLDLWSLLAEAAALAPPGATLEVFVLDRVETLAGTRPNLGHPLEWWAVADPESNRWIQRAVRTPEGIRTTIGTSSATGTSFVSGTLSGEAATSPFVQELGTTTELTLSEPGSRDGDDSVTVPPDAQPLRVAILADDTRAADAMAVRQAIEAVAAHLGRPLVLTEEPGDPLDLVVQLGEASGTAIPASIRLLDNGDASACRQAAYIDALPDPWLKQRRCVDATVGPAHWRDGRGLPLLSLEAPGLPAPSTQTIYRWQGRFDPTWSNLTDGGLPHLLLSLVVPDDEHLQGAGNAGSDRRAAGAGQGRPGSSPPSTKPPAVPDPLPERLAWALVAVLFIVDRLLVGRRA